MSGYGLVLVFHQLICGPDLGGQVKILRNQDPAMDVRIVVGLGDWTTRHCLLIERHIVMPTASGEI